MSISLHPAVRRRSWRVVTSYRSSYRLIASPWKQSTLVFGVMVWLAVPLLMSSYQLTVLAYAAIAAVAALGLNILTGFTGQISLGHGAFVAVGSYSAAALGADRGWPVVAWLPAAALIAGLVALLLGPIALRLRGYYLVAVSLGLIFIAEYVFKNWTSVTGGASGASAVGALPSLDPGRSVQFGPWDLSREQCWFWMLWGVVALAALCSKNLSRGRPGRAMKAVRDRDLAADVTGVSSSRYKVIAFVLSAMYGAVAGALYAPLQSFVNWLEPPGAMLDVSIQYVAILVVGGVGTTLGPIIGALLLGGLPHLIQSLTLAHDIPFVAGDRGGPEGIVSVGSLNLFIYGAVIVIFLVFEPTGLAGLYQRVVGWCRRWPYHH